MYVDFGLTMDDLELILDEEIMIPNDPHDAFVLLGEETYAMG